MLGEDGAHAGHQVLELVDVLFRDWGGRGFREIPDEGREVFASAPVDVLGGSAVLARYGDAAHVLGVAFREEGLEDLDFRGVAYGIDLAGGEFVVNPEELHRGDRGGCGDSL